MNTATVAVAVARCADGLRALSRGIHAQTELAYTEYRSQGGRSGHRGGLSWSCAQWERQIGRVSRRYVTPLPTSGDAA